MQTHERRPAFPYFGGKFDLAPWILSFVPPHRVYVEVFGGAASLLLAKEPVGIEVYNDLDDGLVNFWRVVRDPAAFDRLNLRMHLTPWSRQEHRWCRETWAHVKDPIERAARWYTMLWQTVSAEPDGSGWSYSANPAHSNELANPTVHKWLTRLDGLAQVHHRFRRVQIDNDDFRRVLDRWDGPDTFFYVDPPYVPATRRSGGYRHELALEDHADLVAKLLTLQGTAILSGYRADVYAPLVVGGAGSCTRDRIRRAPRRTRARPAFRAKVRSSATARCARNASTCRRRRARRSLACSAGRTRLDYGPRLGNDEHPDVRERDRREMRREWQRLQRVDARVIELREVRSQRGLLRWSATVESSLGRRVSRAALTAAGAFSACRKHLGYRVVDGEPVYQEELALAGIRRDMGITARTPWAALRRANLTPPGGRS